MAKRADAGRGESAGWGWQRLVRLMTLLTLATGLSACQDYNSWHQKLTLNVETPEGERSGSSVIEVESRFGQVPMSANEVNYDVTGEAAFVEVAPGRYLFALLDDSEAERFYRALGYNYGNRGEKLDRIARMQGESRVLEKKNYPVLVTFADINDPTSVVRVDPDNLAATFGSGYALKSITLEITDERVTKGRIEKVLDAEFFRSWAALNHDTLKRSGIRDPYFKTFASDLNRSNFIRE